VVGERERKSKKGGKKLGFCSKERGESEKKRRGKKKRIQKSTFLFFLEESPAPSDALSLSLALSSERYP
jgi:hypothetical protein